MCLGHKVQKCKTERFSSKETDLLVREVKSAKTSKKHLRRVYDRAHGLQDVSAIFGHWQEWQLHFSTLEESEGASFIFFFYSLWYALTPANNRIGTNKAGFTVTSAPFAEESN